jgi:hypothetical protein
MGKVGAVGFRLLRGRRGATQVKGRAGGGALDVDGQIQSRHRTRRECHGGDELGERTEKQEAARPDYPVNQATERTH